MTQDEIDQYHAHRERRLANMATGARTKVDVRAAMASLDESSTEPDEARAKVAFGNEGMAAATSELRQLMADGERQIQETQRKLKDTPNNG